MNLPLSFAQERLWFLDRLSPGLAVYNQPLGLALDGVALATGKPGTRAFEVFLECFERGVMVRQTGDTIALSPPLIIESKQIARIIETLSAVIRETA